MQVFKLYWKLLRANLKGFFIYLGIFTGLLFGIIIPNQTTNAQKNYMGTQCSFAVCDKDQSECSKAIIEYLSGIHKLEEMQDFSGDVMQDELFYRNVDAILMIKPGFEESLQMGDTQQYADIHIIAGTMNGSLVEQAFNGYVSKIAAYLDGGFSLQDAIAKTNEASRIEMPVRFLDGAATSTNGPEYFFFVYLVWVFVAACIQSVSPVLSIMDRKEVKNRVYFSSYKYGAFNLEIVLATIVTGFMLCGFFLLLAVVLLGVNPISVKGMLWTLNMLCIMVVAMAFTLLASRLTAKPQVLSAMSNIISLGMAFTCGVFVPIEFLGEGVIKAAHFLPAYWYVQATDLISNFTADKMGMILSYMGIELLFGGAIMAIAFLISKRKA